MRIRTLPFLWIAIGTPVLLIIAILVGISFSQTLTPTTAQTLGISSSQATPIHHYGPEAGTISDSLISPDNVTFQIVGIERHATNWLFHIHAHNNADIDTNILNPGTSHYFMLGLQGPAGKPIPPDQGEVVLVAPAQTDAAAHPALPAVVTSQADVDGWLVADLTNAKYKPVQLFYVYGTVTANACANPRDTSTCHTSTGWRTLVWTLDTPS